MGSTALDETGPEPEAFRDLRSATDLALRATKSTAQAIGRAMANLTVLERHLWLVLMEMKDTDKAAFLDAPITSSGLFGPAVKNFTERYSEAQQASQAMRHFLPKRSSSTSGGGRRAPSSQRDKPAPSATKPRPATEIRHCSRSSRRQPFTEKRGPRPKTTPNPEPRKSS